MQDISDYSVSIITEEPEGTFYTNTSGTYPLDRLVRVSGVPFNIPKNATLGMLGVDPSPYSEEIEEIEGNPNHFNLVIRASQNMLTNGDVIHLPSWKRQELLEELDFFSLPPLPKLPTLHNILTAIEERLVLHADGAPEAINAHWPSRPLNRINTTVEEARQEWRESERRRHGPQFDRFVVLFHYSPYIGETIGVNVGLTVPNIVVQKSTPGVPGQITQLPAQTIYQEISGLDRIEVSIHQNWGHILHKSSVSDVFKDPIRVSDGAFLLEVSSTGDFVVELRISPNPL